MVQQLLSKSFLLATLSSRALIIYGTWTGMISLLPLVFTYMVVLMGELACILVERGQNVACSIGTMLHRYSRKILWMELSTTNRDSKVISRYYLEAVERAQGI